jgi:2-polyprenyl-3-methyl-5-hydroxy-6-metoxy-1,4-benzoquinol methylase
MTKNVKDIHNEKRVNMWNEGIENHKPYIDKSTGLFKNEFVEERFCPVCQENNYQKMFSKEGGQYVKCKSCKMVYLNPVFTDEALTQYYMNNQVEQGVVVSDDTSFYANLYNKGLASAENITSVGNILDIGCSSGIFLDIAKGKGWKTYGLELNQIEFSISEGKGHKVQNDLLQNALFDEKFNVISLWDVFEHIKDGDSTLKLMKDLLTDNGVILLQIPSSDALAAKIMQKKCNMFDGLEHTNLYGIESLTKLVESNGLKILDIQSVIPELGVLNNYLSYDDPYKESNNNFGSVLDLFSDEQVLKSLLGYKLQVVIGDK